MACDGPDTHMWCAKSIGEAVARHAAGTVHSVFRHACNIETAGGGLVKVRVNGKFEVLACTIEEEALRLNDREMLEDLMRAATNQALERARQQIAEETGKMATSLGLPPGMSLPGLFGS